jgi:hypothetical protein
MLRSLPRLAAGRLRPPSSTRAVIDRHLRRALPRDGTVIGLASPGKSGASRNPVWLHQHTARLGRPEAGPAPSVLDQISDPRRWVSQVSIWHEIRARDHGDWNYTVKPPRS